MQYWPPLPQFILFSLSFESNTSTNHQSNSFAFTSESICQWGQLITVRGINIRQEDSRETLHWSHGGQFRSLEYLLGILTRIVTPAVHSIKCEWVTDMQCCTTAEAVALSEMPVPRLFVSLAAFGSVPHSFDCYPVEQRLNLCDYYYHLFILICLFIFIFFILLILFILAIFFIYLFPIIRTTWASGRRSPRPVLRRPASVLDRRL